MNLEAIDFKTVLRLAWQQSGLTLEELAQKSGIPFGQIVRYVNPEDEYHPNPYKVVALSRTLETTLLVDWLYAQLNAKPQFNGYSRAIKEMTDVINELTKSLEDGKFNGYEKRKVIKEADEAIQALTALKEHLMAGGEK